MPLDFGKGLAAGENLFVSSTDGDGVKWSRDFLAPLIFF